MLKMFYGLCFEHMLDIFQYSGIFSNTYDTNIERSLSQKSEDKPNLSPTLFKWYFSVIITLFIYLTSFL